MAFCSAFQADKSTLFKEFTKKRRLRNSNQETHQTTPKEGTRKPTWYTSKGTPEVVFLAQSWPSFLFEPMDRSIAIAASRGGCKASAGGLHRGFHRGSHAEESQRSLQAARTYTRNQNGGRSGGTHVTESRRVFGCIVFLRGTL